LQQVLCCSAQEPVDPRIVAGADRMKLWREPSMTAELHTTERLGPPGQGNPVRSIFTLASPGVAAERRIALVGNYLPRKCGIATFTADIFEKLRQFHPEIAVDVYALDDPHRPIAYRNVAATIAYDDPADYAEAARRINESSVDAVWLQHEYGIFGGPDGEMVLEFVDRLAAPLILTPHTVLGEPSPRQLAIVKQLVARSSRIMVMSRHARDLLAEHYGAPHEILEVVPHGGPARPFGRQAEFTARLGLTGRTELTTFGLLGPGKGLETAIGALPAIVERHPEVVYRIVGETHPNLFAIEGEAYRERLQALAGELGVADHIQWENRFLETDELLDQLEACDIYITPYPGMQQSTSGTLSYAVALGKAVVSTPYLHARELLAGGVGEIVEPSSGAIAVAINRLLGDPQRLSAMQRRAYARGRETIWPRFADGAAELIEHAVVASVPRPAPLVTAPAVTAVIAMSDTTGMLQHSIGIVPDRAHGYCLDDNARALMLMNVAEGIAPAERTRWRQVYASFVQHAWNPEAKGFRNFMRFDRSWCEDIGSEDSNGRALWALGQTVETANEPSLRFWAKALYDTALPHCPTEGSPRSVAFAMLGAAALLREIPDHGISRDYLRTGADFLHRLLDASRRPDWAWFEAMLGYDNPRLSQALLEAGLALGEARYIEAGLDSLTWIAGRQIAGSGHFRPIGSDTFGHSHTSLPYDQQPLEALAAIEAAAAASRANRDPVWQHHALAAWRWFFGANDRGVTLADLASGRCRDGLTPRGANENCGAESILAFQLAYYSLIGLLRGNQSDSTRGRETGEPAQRLAKPAAHT
jgi:glycosyltransferase involved in cell wall biosynthesis